MRYVALYLLIGAMVAVWTALNAQRTAAPADAKGPRPNLVSMLPAYALVALAWPLSVLVFVAALVIGLKGREGQARGR